MSEDLLIKPTFNLNKNLQSTLKVYLEVNGSTEVFIKKEKYSHFVHIMINI